MQKVKVDLWCGKPDASYEIVIGAGLIAGLAKLIDLNQYSRIAIVSDENVAPRWVGRLESGLGMTVVKVVIPSGEQNKTLVTLERVLEEFCQHELDRQALVINLGGGVVGDLGGLAAATYMRGIDFVQVPTSLLAQVDASVGGKVAVNLNGLKNLVGVFAQPKLVVVDVTMLATLPLRELQAGFAEVIKHALIASPAYFEWIAGKTLDELSEHDLTSLIRQSCEIKAGLVHTDERERGARKLLNFGHTIGHALEALAWARYESGIAARPEEVLLHGEAVSLGMIVAAEISRLRGQIESADCARIKQTLHKFGLPIAAPFNVTPKEVLDHAVSDKKRVRGRHRWTLLQELGEASFDNDVEDSLVLKALEVLQ